MSFSSNLKRLRKEHELTQYEVAGAVDINMRTLQNYESGKCYPRKRETALRLAEFFKIPANELFSDDDLYPLSSEQNVKTKTYEEIDSILDDLCNLLYQENFSEENKSSIISIIRDKFSHQ